MGHLKKNAMPKAGQWRKLRVGQKLREGDRFWSDARKRWVETQDQGRDLQEDDFKYIRRKTAPTINYQRLAASMYKATKTRAARKIYEKAVKKEGK